MRRGTTNFSDGPPSKRPRFEGPSHGANSAKAESAGGASGPPDKKAHAPALAAPLKPGAIFKTRLCQEWAQKGTCFKGNACIFAHGEEELQPAPANGPSVLPKALPKGAQPQFHKSAMPTPIVPKIGVPAPKIGIPAPKIGKPAPKIGVVTAPKVGQAIPKLGIPLPKGTPQGYPVKKTLCKWWLKGECWSGASCKDAHGEQELNMMEIMEIFADLPGLGEDGEAEEGGAEPESGVGRSAGAAGEAEEDAPGREEGPAGDAAETRGAEYNPESEAEGAEEEWRVDERDIQGDEVGTGQDEGCDEELDTGDAFKLLDL